MPVAYLICTSPRSGSSLLCDGLAKTGRAGAPAEFFDHRNAVTAHWMRRFGIARASEYAEKIIEATSTPNGVFGTKLHWTTHPDMHRAFSDCLRNGADGARQSLDELLRTRFSDVRYVWLRRRNKVAQGISHFRATCNDYWQRVKSPNADSDRRPNAAPFDFLAIDRTIAWAREYDRRWKSYFTYHRLLPLELFYEEFAASYDAHIRRVLEFIGVAHDDLPEMQPSLERMADDTSLEWEQRYRELITANAEEPARDG